MDISSYQENKKQTASNKPPCQPRCHSPQFPDQNSSRGRSPDQRQRSHDRSSRSNSRDRRSSSEDKEFQEFGRIVTGDEENQNSEFCFDLF